MSDRRWLSICDIDHVSVECNLRTAREIWEMNRCKLRLMPLTAATVVQIHKALFNWGLFSGQFLPAFTSRNKNRVGCQAAESKTTRRKTWGPRDFKVTGSGAIRVWTGIAESAALAGLRGRW